MKDRIITAKKTYFLSDSKVRGSTTAKRDLVKGPNTFVKSLMVV